VLSGGEEQLKLIKETSKSKKPVFKNPFTKKTRRLSAQSENVPTDHDTKLGISPQNASQVEPRLFVAKYDYVSGTTDELGFKKGDLLYVMDANNGNWWFARAKQSGQEGYVPSNFVVELDTKKCVVLIYSYIAK